MAGLVPAIHAARPKDVRDLGVTGRKALHSKQFFGPADRPGTIDAPNRVDGPDKPGHDALSAVAVPLHANSQRNKSGLSRLSTPNDVRRDALGAAELRARSPNNSAD
jgi:hypothetical protein